MNTSEYAINPYTIRGGLVTVLSLAQLFNARIAENIPMGPIVLDNEHLSMDEYTVLDALCKEYQEAK